MLVWSGDHTLRTTVRVFKNDLIYKLSKNGITHLILLGNSQLNSWDAYILDDSGESPRWSLLGYFEGDSMVKKKTSGPMLKGIEKTV